MDEEAALTPSPGHAGPTPAPGEPLSDRDILAAFGMTLQDSLTLGLEATETDCCAELSRDLPGLPPSLTLNASSARDDPFAGSRELSMRLESRPDSALWPLPDGKGTQLTAEGPEEEEESRQDRDISQLFKDLDERLLMAAQAHIPEEYVQRWAVEIILALDALHQEGIVCRDLNPNNILLSDRGHIQLTYFCSWSEVEDSCDREAVARMYCAPEVGSISEETVACDWWSLGAILFELLTGKSLSQCHPAGISRHTSLNVPEFLSEEAKSLLQQLLQFNPIERLGAGVAGAEDIKSHPFFARVDWPK
ncbi:hypothetical protein AAFF_G00202050 [Aldrovandia affinis]|uniref:Protein kinase domain-containing protein n=1 Tax=Aldrovandia affinis TaxID=143900 RepID=A0AAD7SWT1_9TELE|nr:hypothetical protein AAFF_G00202050 [Aldrovandia affinis]